VTVDPDTWTTWDVEPRDVPRGRCEGVRIFGIDPALKGVTMAVYIGLGKGERFTAGNPDAFGDDVDSGGHLRNGMFDLHTGIHLDEEELLLLDQEFEGADTLVANPSAGFDAAFPDLCYKFGWKAGCWRFLQNLLVATLE
jgi:hypothetical protein